MKEKSYWEQFVQSGKVEDYLKYKNEPYNNVTKDELNPKGDVLSAGINSRNRDDYQGSAYRGIR